MKTSIPLLALLLCAAMLSAKEEPSPGLSVIHKDVLGGEGSWDYLSIDSAARRIYIARETRVLVVDMNTRKVLKEIEGTSGVHGFAIVADLNKGFSSNGRSNTVTIFDLKTFEKIGEAKTGPKPDAIVYEPVSKRVFAFNNGGTTATAIDAATGAVAGTVELGGAPEFAVSDMKGMMFVNLEDKSEVVQFDPVKLTVVHRWPLAPGKTPTGLAIDLEHHRLFSACRGSKSLVVLNADDGKIVASLPIGAGVDAAAFDPATQNAFASNGDGTLTVVHETAPDAYSVTQTVSTQQNAKTMALDLSTHEVWTVAGDRKKPGTFTLLVIGKKN